MFSFNECMIKKFENNNKVNINIFSYDKSTIFPLHFSSFSYDTGIDLLLISNGKTNHCTLKKNIDKLLNNCIEESHNKTFHC